LATLPSFNHCMVSWRWCERCVPSPGLSTVISFRTHVC